MDGRGRWLALSVIALACGGEAPPPPSQPATDVAETAVQDTAAAESPSTQLVREVFSYRGSGRDPFRSLVSPGQNLRPFLEDLRVVSIQYDARFPARSVAILRDTTVNERYAVRVDDEIGRMRVTEIRPAEVVIMIEDFGVPRQEVLMVRRRGTAGGVR